MRTVDQYLYGKVQDENLDEPDIRALKLVDRSKSNNQAENKEEEKEPEP